MTEIIYHLQETYERLEAIPRKGTSAVVYREVVAARRAVVAAMHAVGVEPLLSQAARKV